MLALGLSACGGNGGDVTAPQASQLAFTVQPSAGKAEQVLPPFEVSVLDASGGPVAEGTYTVTLTVENNPSSAALGGMTSVASAGGRAAFASVSVSSAGNGFTLKASAPELAPAISAPFDVAPASPAGSLSGHIVFTSNRSGRDQLYAIMPDGSNLTKLSHDTVQESSPAASPDGRRLAFTRAGFRTIVRDLSDGGETELTGLAESRYLTWSPDGQWLASIQGTTGPIGPYSFPLRVARIDDTEAHDLATGRGLTFGPSISGFSWSPDASQLVYAVVADLQNCLTGRLSLKIIGRGGGTPSLLTADSLSESGPAWSPDGGRIAFATCIYLYPECPPAIETIHPDGTGRIKLSELSAYLGPVWSPDGTRLAFVSGAPAGVYVISASGGEARNLFAGVEVGGYPPVRWSPDGSRLAFVSGATGVRDIYVVDADGTNLRQLTTDPANDSEFTWVP